MAWALRIVIIFLEDMENMAIRGVFRPPGWIDGFLERAALDLLWYGKLNEVLEWI